MATTSPKPLTATFGSDLRSDCRPLIQGEAYPPYAEGMPLYCPLSLPS